MISTTLQRTIKTYNRTAVKYAEEVEDKLDIKELQTFAKLIGKKGKILDAGCGAGKDGAYLVTQGFEVVGIDLASDLLKVANKKHPELKTQLMDIGQMTFADSSFDGVWANASLVHLDKTHELPQALKEISRVLKEGGILYLSLKLGEGEGWDEVSEKYVAYYTKEEVIGLLVESGFTLIQAYIAPSRRKGLEWVRVFSGTDKS